MVVVVVFVFVVVVVVVDVVDVVVVVVVLLLCCYPINVSKINIKPNKKPRQTVSQAYPGADGTVRSKARCLVRGEHTW